MCGGLVRYKYNNVQNSDKINVQTPSLKKISSPKCALKNPRTFQDTTELVRFVKKIESDYRYNNNDIPLSIFRTLSKSKKSVHTNMYAFVALDY